MAGFVRKCLDRVLTYAIGLCFAFFPLLGLALKSLYKGRSVWSAKARPKPPLCLSDPEYGEHRFVKLQNIRLHYVESGDQTKPLVVFLHGFPEFWYSWRHQIKAFKKSFWTVAVDMRGYGDSDKPTGIKSYDDELLVDDVKQLIKALGRSSCILIAHDWGGIVAYLMAKRYPEMIEKMVILNSPHPRSWLQLIQSSWSQFFKSWYVFLDQLPAVPEIIAVADDLFVLERIFWRSTKGRQSFSDNDMEALKYTFSTRDKWTGPVNYYRSFYVKRHEIAEEMSVKIAVPTLIIWGCNDFALETELAKMSSDNFLNCSVKYVDDAGHFVQEESPTIVNQFIEQFLKGEE